MLNENTISSEHSASEGALPEVTSYTHIKPGARMIPTTDS